MAPKAINYGTYKQILNQTSRTTVLPDIYYDELPQEIRRMAFTVSGMTRMDAIDDVLKSFERAEAEGMDFADWADSFNVDEFERLTESHKKTVFTTNMTTQYNNGRLQVGINSDTLVYLKYQATLDDRTRPNHAAMDGITLPINDPFWLTHTPPNGYNCRCFVLNLDAKDLDDNPITPKSDINRNEVKPDEGFGTSSENPEPALTKLYRDKAKTLPQEIRSAALDRLMEKTKDQKDWWKNAKKDFVKPE